jgi:hypothetical protein
MNSNQTKKTWIMQNEGITKKLQKRNNGGASYCIKKTTNNNPELNIKL